MTSAPLPIRERLSRTLAAGLLAPASLVGLDLIHKCMGSFFVDGHIEKYFFEGMFVFTIGASYLGSAVVGGLASALRWALKAPLQAWVVVSQFAACAAMLGLLVDADWRLRGLAALATGALSLPVSLTYCAVAGIRWR